MEILLLSLMRLNSEKQPRRLLARIGEIPLAQRAMEILASVRSPVQKRVAVCPFDAELFQAIEQLKFPYFLRSRESRDGKLLSEIFDERLKDKLRKYDWVILVKPTLPYLRPATIERAITRILQGETEAFQTAFRNQGRVWDQFGKPVIGGDNPLLAQEGEVYYSACDAVYAYPTASVGDADSMRIRGFMAVERTPEFLDIASPRDLQIAATWDQLLRTDHAPEKGSTGS